MKQRCSQQLCEQCGFKVHFMMYPTQCPKALFPSCFCLVSTVQIHGACRQRVLLCGETSWCGAFSLHWMQVSVHLHQSTPLHSCPQPWAQPAAAAFDDGLPLPPGPEHCPAYRPGGPLDPAVLLESKFHCGGDGPVPLLPFPG